MDEIKSSFRYPLLLSSILVAPFLVLELVNRRGYGEGFPAPLFILMWLLPLAFMLVLPSALRKIREPNRTWTTAAAALLQAGLLILIAWMWVGVIADQMPCFLGVPLCD